MKIKALESIIKYDGGAMIVLNAGDEGVVSEALAAQLVTAGTAAVIEYELSPLDHDGDGHPGGSLPKVPPVLIGKNKKQLLAIAEDEGVDVPEGATNSAIIEAIEDARAAADDDDAAIDHDGDDNDGAEDAPPAA